MTERMIASRMPCSTPTTTTSKAVMAATANSPRAQPVDAVHALVVDEPDADEEDDGASTALGM